MKQIPFVKPLVQREEIQAVTEVLKSGWYTQGEIVEKFEEKFAKYIGLKEAVAVFNGTVALHLTMIVSGVDSNDEVIVPSLTFISTANAALFQKAKPIFAEINEKTFNITYEDIENKITNKTKAIIPVHYAGQVADMDSIIKIAKEHNLFIIEDAAQAHGAKYKGKHAGAFGDMAIFSFTPMKNMTTGEGGMIVTNNHTFAKQLRMLRNHGMDAPYHHVFLGYNYRMTEMQAAIGLVQLQKLDYIIKRKKEIVKFYNSEFEKIPDITIPFVDPNTTVHGYCFYSIKVPSNIRNELITELLKKGIAAKVYFPPVHLQPYYHSLGYKEGILPITEQIAKQIISLPTRANLSNQDIKYISKTVKELMADKNKINST